VNAAVEQQDDFQGRVAMVTGAARGIGQASALSFARRGANVVVCDVLDEADETVKLIESAGRSAIFVQTDVSHGEAVRRAVESGIDAFGRLDFAHNNAGIGTSSLLADMSEDEWDRVIRVNLTGVFLCMKYQLPHLIENGGAIVNTASVWSMVGAATMAAYCASKHGVVGLTKTAARDYGPAGVRVNAIAPGPIQTVLTAEVPADVINAIIARTAQGRYGQPGEIGEAVTWLCSPSASYVNGAVLAVDGGWLAG
jgi:NAD(P)-dependent dehydrogenase (short-subunit alcohol dehydrogenase family)